MEKIIIQNKTYDEERALYNLCDALVLNTKFEGPADGESALKEARRIEVKDSSFSLRYPLWHVDEFSLDNISMNSTTRAALWYSTNGKINNSTLGGIKALRECKNIEIDNSIMDSSEFGWKCDNITITNSKLNSEYLFLDSSNITLSNIMMYGKYSFQYVKNLTITNSVLNTKDAFWHAKNVVVKDSIINGEYLGWFSKDLTLINCEIVGTQPFCYCTNLKIVNCTMKDCDLSFEYSSVEADVKGHVDSIKNPLNGTIVVDSVGELINDKPVYECKGIVKIRKK